MLGSILTAWRLLRAKDPNTILILLLIIGVFIGMMYAFTKKDGPPKPDLIQVKTVEIVQQEKSRDSLIYVSKILEKEITIDSLKQLIQKHHEEDSLSRNRKLTELEAMRSINRSLRLNSNGK